MKKYSLLLLSLLTILAWGCKKEKEPENPIEIGKFYAGGYIFYHCCPTKIGFKIAVTLY
jgi:hypothetical protein